jgi:RNA methyltransferase, TrmH family
MGPVMIASRHNSRIKQIRSLRHRGERERTGLSFIEGIHLVAAAVQTGAAIEELVIAPEVLRSPFARELLRMPRRNMAPCLEVAPEVFRSFSERERPQGIGAVVRQRWHSPEEVGRVGERSWVVLESVQYPGNLGTILRTCDAVGGAGVILIGPTADPYDPASVRASMGAVFAQRLVRAGVAELAAWKRRRHHTLVGTSPAAATDYRAASYRPPALLLMGGEQTGLSPAMQALCDVTVRIPMVGRSDSLNLAVATGIVLYEIFGQQARPCPREETSTRSPLRPAGPGGNSSERNQR